MSIIVVENVLKEYKKINRSPGPLGVFKSLFSREYSTTRAVEDTSFTINKGDSVGYVGPNGAGKSTMIKMLTGILVPTSGEVRVNGVVPHKHRKENAKNISVVFGQRSQLWTDLPVIDTFQLHKDIYKINKSDYDHSLELFSDLLGLHEFMDSYVNHLSLGQRMRAELALALLHQPDIVFFDEPTIGLDVLAKDKIRTFLRTINRERNVTIMLTSHDLKDIEEVCNRLLIVNKGKIIYDGTVDKFRASSGDYRRIIVEFSSNPGEIHVDGATLVKDQGKVKEFEFDRSSGSVVSLINSLNQICTIEDIRLKDSDIEGVIRELYTDIQSM